MYRKSCVVAAVAGMTITAASIAAPADPAPHAATFGTHVQTADIGTSNTVERWKLAVNQPIHAQLQDWASRAGWQLTWQPKVSWLVAADTYFEGNFQSVIQEVVNGLFFEGKPVRLVIWEGNRFAEVVSNDVR